MIRPLVVLGCLLVPSVFVSSANAQLVRVGPWGGVRVRVPLVSVDVSPWGDTRVRAPFTHVEAPGDYYRSHRYDHRGHHGHYDRGYRGYYYPHVFSDDFGLPPYRGYDRDFYGSQYAPPAGAPYHPSRGAVAVPQRERGSSDFRVDEDAYRVPRGDSPGRLSPSGAADALRSAAARLRASLSRRGEQGEIWLDYLQPDRIIAAIDGGESPASLQPLLANYEGVTNSQVGWVSRVDGFHQTRRLLASFVTTGSNDRPAAERQDTRQRGGRETLELPPPSPEPPPRPRPEGAGADVGDQGDPAQSAAANSPERFAL